MRKNVEIKTIATPVAVPFNGFVKVLAGHFDLSVAEMKRLFVHGAVHLSVPDSDGEWEKMEVNTPVLLDGSVLRVGKHRFAKLPVETKPVTVEMWEE